MSDKPDISIAWSTTGTNVKPANSKIDGGWIAEKPPFQTYNWWQNRIDSFAQHVNISGIVEWDALTTYIIGSISKGSDGIIYKSKTSNLNIDPVVVGPGADWKRADFIEDGTILDNNGNELIIFSGIGSAVNQIVIENSPAGLAPKIYQTGADDVGIEIEGVLLKNGVLTGSVNQTSIGIYSGMLGAAGTITRPIAGIPGLVGSRIAAGHYRVTHNLNTTDISVVATIMLSVFGGTSAVVFSDTTVDPNYFDLRIYVDGALLDSNVAFTMSTF